MNNYFSTFITGFSDVIRQEVTNLIPNINIDKLDDGLMIYKTPQIPEEIRKLRFFNNSFLMIDQLHDTDPNKIFKTLISSNLEQLLGEIDFSGKKTFRLRIVKENEPIKVDNDLLSQLEGAIFQVTKLNVSRGGADLEFWIMSRKEGFTLFGIRLTSHGNYEKLLQKGEIRPELSNLLCLLSTPSKDDIFLDPFCGSGSIPIERARAFPYKQVLAGDIRPEIIDKLRAKFKISNLKFKIIVGRWDATDLKTFHDNSVDKIVTDPPWGIHSGKNLSLKDFYDNMLKEFNRILKPNGIIILLVSQQINMEQVLSSHPNFKLKEKYTTLVNGQKSAVYKVVKS